MRKFFVAAALAVAFFVGSATSAEAAFKLRIDNGTTTGTVITDGGALDTLSPGTDGTIITTATIGGFTVSVTTGISQPPNIVNTAGYDGLHLNNVSIATTSAGSITFWLSKDDFGTAPDGPLELLATISATLPTNATLTGQAWVSPSAATPAFGADSAVGGIPAVGAIPGDAVAAFIPAFTAGTPGGIDTGKGNFDKSGTYSMFIKVTVNFSGAGTASFDAEAITTPAPAGLALVLAGAPVLGFGAWRRRRSTSTVA